jgi:hypothetical protein
MEEAAGAVVVEEVATGVAGAEVVAVGGGFHGLDTAATRPKTEVVAVGGGFHGLDTAATRPKTSSKAPSSKAKAALGQLW